MDKTIDITLETKQSIEDLKTSGPELAKLFLKEMLLIRRFEETAGQEYGLRKIGGFCHLYIGQEAVAVGAIKPLDLPDI
jgi:pyruvate dehydrogenase E1 component alpha subunit